MGWGKMKGKPLAGQTGNVDTTEASSSGPVGLEDLFADQPGPATTHGSVEELELDPIPDPLPEPAPAPAHRHEPRQNPLGDFAAAQAPTRTTPTERHSSHIGASIHIEGELTSKEDISIEGTVEGIVSVQEHKVTVTGKGMVRAEIQARSVTVFGKVVGNISATDVVQVMTTGSMEGDIRAGRVVLADGAKFRGNIQMGWEAPAPADAGETDTGDERTHGSNATVHG